MERAHFYVLAGVVSLSLFATASTAGVCGYVGESDKVRAARSDAVFVGVPIVMMLQEKPYSLPDETSYGPSGRRLKFRVTHAWKGVETGFVWVDTGMGWTDCSGYPFDVGQWYLVYAVRGSDGQLRVSRNGARDLGFGRPGTKDLEMALGPVAKAFKHESGSNSITCSP